MNQDHHIESSSPMSGELTKALIDKVMELGNSIRGTEELIRKIPDSVASLGELDKRIAGQAKELVKVLEGIDLIRFELGIISRQPSFPTASIEGLSSQLTQHANLFKAPLKKSVHYTHFIGRSVWVVTTLILLIIGILSGWFRTWIKADRYKENDILWRAAIINEDPQLPLKLIGIKTSYHTDPDQFTRNVIEEEDRLQKLFEQFTQKKQAEQEILQLQEKKKPLP